MQAQSMPVAPVAVPSHGCTESPSPATEDVVPMSTAHQIIPPAVWAKLRAAAAGTLFRPHSDGESHEFGRYPGERAFDAALFLKEEWLRYPKAEGGAPVVVA